VVLVSTPLPTEVTVTSTLTDATTLPVRKGARVLADVAHFGVGRVEGLAVLPGSAFPGDTRYHTVRWANGDVTREPAASGVLVAIDFTTVPVEDQHNNVGRRCNVPGDGPAGEPVRCWQVAYAVSGSRYLVAHLRTGRVRLVAQRDMHNLY
jgi:hypothetical protein